MISDLSVTDGMLASNLMQTMDWKLEGDEVSAVTENKFEHMQIMQSAAKIADCISQAYGRRISFKILYREKSVQNSVGKLPEEVEILRDVFKGSIIGGA